MSSLSKITILTKRKEFLACAASGKKFVRPTLVMQVRKREEEIVAADAVRIGFTCTKTLGNAVVRNRIKRRLREAARQVLPLHGKAGHDYVLIGRGQAERCAYDDILSDLTMALSRVHAHEKPAPAVA